MNWMFLPLKRYADFQGRSRRKEYWMFFLLQLIIYAAVMLIGGAVLGTSMPTPGPDGYDDAASAAMMGMSSGVMILYLVVALALLLPSLAVTVRRFHDQDKSGWMVLLGLVPFIGGLILLVFMFLEGTRGPNRYGEDPKDTEYA